MSEDKPSLWSRYSHVMDRFRRLCRGNEAQRVAADTKYRAKRFAEQWDAKRKPRADVLRLSEGVEAIVLGSDDLEKIKRASEARIAFRDRVANSLGKEEGESWDAFYNRCNVVARIPHVVKTFELAIRDTQAERGQA